MIAKIDEHLRRLSAVQEKAAATEELNLEDPRLRASRTRGGGQTDSV
jgi:hypothetical protein